MLRWPGNASASTPFCHANQMNSGRMDKNYFSLFIGNQNIDFKVSRMEEQVLDKDFLSWSLRLIRVVWLVAEVFSS